MPFILCALDRKSEEANLVFTRSFASRAEAVDALASLSGLEAFEDSDLFAVDLDAATPVVLVGAPVPAAVEAPGSDEAAEPVADWPFVPTDQTGGVGLSTLESDRAEDDADRAQVWWLEVGAETETEPEPQATAGADVEPETTAELGTDGPLQQPTVPSLEASVPEIAEEPLPAPEDTVPEEPEGALSVDFEVWTCSNCIFVTTCPRTTTHRPATCGSFQWRAE